MGQNEAGEVGRQVQLDLLSPGSIYLRSIGNQRWSVSWGWGWPEETRLWKGSIFCLELRGLCFPWQKLLILMNLELCFCHQPRGSLASICTRVHFSSTHNYNCHCLSWVCLTGSTAVLLLCLDPVVRLGSCNICDYTNILTAFSFFFPLIFACLTAISCSWWLSTVFCSDLDLYYIKRIVPHVTSRISNPEFILYDVKLSLFYDSSCTCSSSSCLLNLSPACHLLSVWNLWSVLLWLWYQVFIIFIPASFLFWITPHFSHYLLLHPTYWVFLDKTLTILLGTCSLVTWTVSSLFLGFLISVVLIGWISTLTVH